MALFGPNVGACSSRDSATGERDEDLGGSITTWKAQLEGGAADVFGAGGGSEAIAPVVDVKSLHAKIGELTLENDFLESALTKAGLLSAKK